MKCTALVTVCVRRVKAWFPYGRPDRPDRPNRPSRLKKNVQTTGTIIWKRYPDDRKRPGRFKIYTIVPIVRIELNSIQAIEIVSVVRVVCDRLGSVSI